MMKKTMLILGCFLLTCAFVMGGGQGSQGSAGPSGMVIDRSNFTTLGTFPIVREKAELTLAVRAAVPPMDFETNWFTGFYEDKTNVHINFVQFPIDRFRERVNLAFASAEYLDYIVSQGHANTTYTRTEILKFVQQGVILPVQDLIQTDTIHMKAGLDTIPSLRESFQLPDGSIYMPLSYGETYHAKFYGKMWVNMVFLNNLNMQIPTTTQEFRDMLIAFKTRDPNRDGRPNDIVPMAGAIDNFSTKIDTFLMSAFVLDDGEDRVYLDNGKVTASFIQPGFRDGLRYLAQLWSEGLIHQDTFVWNRDARLRFNSQRFESIIGAIPNNIHSQIGTRETGQPQRWLDYRPIAPLKGPNGLQITRHTYYLTDERNSGFIPVTSKNPALVMRWLDWLYTEEGLTTYQYGGKGVGWTDGDPGATGPAATPATIKPIVLRQGDPLYGNVVWGNGLPNYQTQKWRNLLQQPADMMEPTGTGLERFLYYWTEQNYVPYGAPPSMLIPPLFYEEADAMAMANLRTTINTYVEESIARFVTGQMNVDRDWDRFQTELRNIGVDRYLKVIQDTYDKSVFARRR
jgi:putative aldouronate transport system substrate-binding protein